MLTILGIDPGSRITGFGLIQSNGLQHKYLISGTIKISENNFSLRLKQIFKDIEEIIKNYSPHEAAVERVFMSTNASSALKLGQARGSAIAAIACQDILLAEYSPRQIKQAIVGYGGAEKIQVQHMVKKLLNVSGKIAVDAADALAIALCHAHSRGNKLK